MWYTWIEAQRNLVRTARALGWPALAGYDGASQLLQPLPPVPGFDIAAVTIGGNPVPVTEEIVDSTPFCALRRFSRERDALPSARRADPAILLCAPLAGHHAVMLRDMVETLLEDGDVYLTDWTDARDVPLAEGDFGLDDCVLAVERFMHKIGGERMHVVAVCQACVPALAALALVANSGAVPAASLALMGGPIDTRIHPSSLARFAQSHSVDWFCRTLIDSVPQPYAGAGRRVYPGFYQQIAMFTSFPQHKWALEAGYWSCRLAGNEAGIARSLRDLGEYAAVLDMDEHYFLDTIRVIFQEQRLARGTWRIGGRLVRPRALSSLALCTVEGGRDNVTGAGQTHAAHALCGAIPESFRQQLTIAGCDHYGLFSGERWRDAIHPALVRFWRSLPARVAPNSATNPTERQPSTEVCDRPG
ncbi:polyhydroxyalkanoate depolymerase [Trinickia violacea]|uniref:Polyhydroxyalkanoate depolymerase n=1 Tax=Trinickia violacea TaxID=2571746 RepID=A0A4P8IRR2_9BURK|nr:polyhydroxyalkanoate depolymerase [Trinickia violacea]QCP49883.1 polyhydroxyalkanoate depolymerase [Trinickia violacea]